MWALHTLKFTVLLFGAFVWQDGKAHAQYVITSGTSQFFDVGVGGGGRTDSPRRFANDSLLAIVQPPTNGYVFMARKRSAALVDEATQRAKRQWNAMATSFYSPQQRFYSAYTAPAVSGSLGYCPASCVPCSYAQCRSYQTRCSPTTVNCCCPTVTQYKYDLKDSCDGEEAVAGCINGLCGQGYVCTARQFCCKCASGRSIGNCVKSMCPQGFTCNDNNQCCSTSNGVNGPVVTAGSILGRCVNDRCPVGFVCESDNYCHAIAPFFGTNNNVTFFTPGASSVILSKCVNDCCPVGYTCGVGNLCYTNTKIDSKLPYIFGRCDHGLCPLGYTCGTDDFCYSNVLPVTRIGGRPEVLGRCDVRLCPAGYTCGSDDFCHQNAEVLPRSRPVRKNHSHQNVDEIDNDNVNDDSSINCGDDDAPTNRTEDASAGALRRRRTGKSERYRASFLNLRKVPSKQREIHGHKARSGRGTRRGKSRYDKEDEDGDDEDEDFVRTNKVNERGYLLALNDAGDAIEAAQMPTAAIANAITVI